MGSQRTSFAKLQRDRAKKAKAAAKREMRQDRTTATGEDEDQEQEAVDVAGGDHELSAAELLVLIEQIHQQYDAKQISLDDFEERKADLLARLPID